MLPAIYEMEDYESCIANHNHYCKLSATLQIPLNNTYLLQQINELNSNDSQFDRNIIYRAMCLSKHQLPDETHLTNHLNDKLKKYNLTSVINFHFCTNGETPISVYDNFVLYSFVVYLAFILYATYYEATSKTSQISGNGSLLQHFSLLRSWRNRTNISKKEDYQKLLCMQGIRFYNMLNVIFGHVFLNFFCIYIADPKELEQILMGNEIMKCITVIGLFIVLKYFLLSSWLSTLQVYNHYEEYGNISIKDIGIIVLNRYFRLSTTAILVIFGAWCTNWPLTIAGPLNFDVIYRSVEVCRNRWFLNILYVNNFFCLFDMCNPVTWSLSADFQMYLINIFVVYAILKYKLNEYKIYGMVLIFSCFLNGAILYYYNINVLFRPSIRKLELEHFRKSAEFIHAYTSTTAIASSSCIGIIMGSIYFKNKNKSLKLTQFHQISWWLLFIGLPSLACIASAKSYGRLGGAIVGAIAKPMYCLGFGIGILGMSHNMGGKVKKFFENKYVAFLSNFCFSTYLCHMILVFQTYRNQPPMFNGFILMMNFFVVVVISIPCGIFLTLTVEEPCLSLQKKLLPQIKKHLKVT